MRRIIVPSFITLDGVLQAPGGPDEDTASGFKYGGWSVPYTDKESGKLMLEQMDPTDLLLGRKTFEIFANYWPTHADLWPRINDVTKYCLSNTLTKSNWAHSVFLKTVTDIQNLKNSDGPDLKVWGSGQLVQLLLQHDLVDELWLKIYPVTLGQGKKLFESGTIPAAFTLTKSAVTPKGVIFANYTRAGKVETGDFGA